MLTYTRIYISPWPGLPARRGARRAAALPALAALTQGLSRMLAYVCAAQQPLLAFALRVLLLLHGLSVGPAAQTVPPPPALTLHVRAGGGDEALAAGSVAADGSVERPFRSIHAARDHLRLLRRQQPLGAVRVQIAPGRYPPLELTAEDSGASLATPITYEGECVDGSSLISAGVAVPASAFRPWPGHRGVLMADLSSFAIERGELGAGGSCYGNCTMFRHNGVVFGSRSMVLARYPNIAMNTTTFELPTVYSWIPINHGHNATLLLSTQNDSDAARVAGWAKEAAPWVHIYASFDWDDTWHPVTIQTNRTRGGDGIEVQVSLLPAWTANSTASTNPIKPSLQSRFYGANLLSELDSPGEYMIVNDTLYFYPPIPLEQWDAAAGHEVVITSNLTAVHASADHVVLKNLAIRHARGNGVLALNVTNVRVEGCSISGHGQHGVVIVGSHSGVEQSDIFSVGCSGVRVAGGDARSLTHGHSFARHNTITDFALHKRAYSPGVFWNGVGNDYSFNNVSRSPHNCISGGGNVGQGKRGEPWGDTGADAPSNVVAGWGSECTIEGNRLDTCAMEVRPTGLLACLSPISIYFLFVHT
jgi:hypothetical protein